MPPLCLRKLQLASYALQLKESCPLGSTVVCYPGVQLCLRSGSRTP